MGITGRDLITEARTWVNVPWRKKGRTRDGIDCVGHLAVVAQHFGIPYTDDLEYGAFFDPKRMVAVLKLTMDEVPKKEMSTGDVPVFAVKGDRMHTAFYDKQANTIIHAALDHGKVVEGQLNDEWRKKIRMVLRVRGLD